MKKILHSLQQVQSKQDLNRIADQLFLCLRAHQQNISDRDWSGIGKIVSLMMTYYQGLFKDDSKRRELCQFMAEFIVGHCEFSSGILSAMSIFADFPLEVLESLNELIPSREMDLILLTRKLEEESYLHAERFETLSLQVEASSEAEKEMMEIISEPKIIEVVEKTDDFCRSYFKEHESDILRKTEQTMEAMNKRIEQMEKEIKRIMPDRRLDPRTVAQWIEHIDDIEITKPEYPVAKAVEPRKQVKVQPKQIPKRIKASPPKSRMVIPKQPAKGIPSKIIVPETPNAKGNDQRYQADKVIQEIKNKNKPKGQAI